MPTPSILEIFSFECPKEKGYETKKSNFDVRFTHRSSEELLYKEEFTGFI
jgi:hypothetical protein